MWRNILFLLSFAVISNPSANAENFILNIEGTVINITSPYGFYKVRPSNKVASKLSKMVTPDTNTLLATLLTKSDIKRSRYGEFPLAKEYILIQTPKSHSKFNLSHSNFKELKESIKKQQNILMVRYEDKIDRIMKDISSKFNNEYGEGHTVEINSSIPLGVFMDKREAVGLTTVATYNLPDVDFSQQVIGATSFILANKKILFVYVYKKVENLVNDKIWVEAKSNEFVDLILEDN